MRVSDAREHQHSAGHTWQTPAAELQVCENAERLAGCRATQGRTVQTPSARMRSELKALRRDMGPRTRLTGLLVIRLAISHK